MRFKIILRGGLGNQMFQYAFGKSLSKKYNANLYLSTNNLADADVPRNYMLDEMFGIKSNEGSDIDWNLHITEPHPYVDGCELNYDNLEPGNYIIEGYWQNENYFNNVKDELREDFKLEPIQTGEKSIIVQVRRMDFVNNQAHEYCNADWYKNAISEFDFDIIYFISDDINWCKETFNYENMRFVLGNEMDHFKHMYGSTKFVISNSSFGWWGAWWTDTENVICPAVWLPTDPNWNTARSKWNIK
jgi:hypothetical protein